MQTERTGLIPTLERMTIIGGLQPDFIGTVGRLYLLDKLIESYPQDGFFPQLREGRRERLSDLMKLELSQYDGFYGDVSLIQNLLDDDQDHVESRRGLFEEWEEAGREQMHDLVRSSLPEKICHALPEISEILIHKKIKAEKPRDLYDEFSRLLDTIISIVPAVSARLIEAGSNTDEQIAALDLIYLSAGLSVLFSDKIMKNAGGDKAKK
jgi:hypothetical protein